MMAKPPSGPVPIGREPVLRPLDDPASQFSLFAPDEPLPGVLLPQAAVLDGTVLRVGTQSCDLATASAVRVRTARSATGWIVRDSRYRAELLEVRQDQQEPRIELVIAAYGASLFRAGHLRILAQILAGRSWPPGRAGRDARRAVDFLSGLADYLDRQDRPVDWSFRAGPMADRRRSAGDYA